MGNAIEGAVGRIAFWACIVVLVAMALALIGSWVLAFVVVALCAAVLWREARPPIPASLSVLGHIAFKALRFVCFLVLISALGYFCYLRSERQGVFAGAGPFTVGLLVLARVFLGWSGDAPPADDAVTDAAPPPPDDPTGSSPRSWPAPVAPPRPPDLE